jgi:hypothetical protein
MPIADWAAVICVAGAVANLALLVWLAHVINRWRRLNSMLFYLCLGAWKLRQIGGAQALPRFFASMRNRKA